jgi:hypothetical protein
MCCVSKYNKPKEAGKLHYKIMLLREAVLLFV